MTSNTSINNDVNTTLLAKIWYYADKADQPKLLRDIAENCDGYKCIHVGVEIARLAQGFLGEEQNLTQKVVKNDSKTRQG